MAQKIVPPFTEETALAKVQAAENLWNTRDPEKVVLGYSPDSVWRNRAEFLNGRDEIKAFLRRKWDRELEYRLKKTLWTFNGNRIAVTFEYEWHDDSGQWFRSYGNELWEFDTDGLMRRRIASINDAPPPSVALQRDGILKFASPNCSFAFSNSLQISLLHLLNVSRVNYASAGRGHVNRSDQTSGTGISCHKTNRRF